MRKSRVNLPNRCYHLISRVAHRAFFLDDGERTRLVDLVRRVSRFSGVKLLAYGVMSNHFHVFVYIGHPERIDDAEIVRRIASLYSDARFNQVMGMEGSDLIATVNCHSRSCLWYNFRHEKISRQPSQPVLSPDQSCRPSCVLSRRRGAYAA